VETSCVNLEKMIHCFFFVFTFTLVNGISRMHHGKLVEQSDKLPTVDDKFSKTFEQSLDHFDRQNHVTFKQRYFLNDTFWSGSASAPVFLCVGGEGPPLDWSVLVSSVHCNDMVELAPKYGALLLALEHRYYGPSNPFSDYSTENLKWLNSEQALGDIASFHNFISSQMSLKESNKWVTFGGSYPGMLAALARLRYPHLIHAAVSSSAPLKASVDMPGYNNVVSQSIASVDVGGSEKCRLAVRDGHVDIGENLKTDEGIAYLEKTFNICQAGTLKDTKNQEQFTGDGVVYIPVQSNDPSCSSAYCDIASICTLMTDEAVGTPLERLAVLSKSQNSNSCISSSYDSMIAYYKAPANPSRTWLYQTCTEWGFYQTCNVDSLCPFTQGLHTLDIDYDLCNAAFGISSESVIAQIAYTNKMYGGSNIQGSRIFFVNGEIDPWHANSVLHAPNADEPTYWVKAASHHFWTHPSLSTDSKYVVKAREAIWNQVFFIYF
jgi:hypothetical protein